MTPGSPAHPLAAAGSPASRHSDSCPACVNSPAESLRGSPACSWSTSWSPARTATRRPSGLDRSDSSPPGSSVGVEAERWSGCRGFRARHRHCSAWAMPRSIRYSVSASRTRATTSAGMPVRSAMYLDSSSRSTSGAPCSVSMVPSRAPAIFASNLPHTRALPTPEPTLTKYERRSRSCCSLNERSRPGAARIQAAVTCRPPARLNETGYQAPALSRLTEATP